MVASSREAGNPRIMPLRWRRTAASLNMKFSTTPLLGTDVGDGFSEVPAVTVKILHVVLSPAARMILRLTKNNGAVLPRSLALSFGLFNATLNLLRVVGRRFAFSERE